MSILASPNVCAVSDPVGHVGHAVLVLDPVVDLYPPDFLINVIRIAIFSSLIDFY